MLPAILLALAVAVASGVTGGGPTSSVAVSGSGPVAVPMSPSGGGPVDSPSGGGPIDSPGGGGPI